MSAHLLQLIFKAPRQMSLTGLTKKRMLGQRFTEPFEVRIEHLARVTRRTLKRLGCAHDFVS